MTRVEQLNRREANAMATLVFIKMHWRSHGFGPSYRDIETNVGISAGSAVISVATLAERGLVSVEPGVARSIRPMKKGK